MDWICKAKQSIECVQDNVCKRQSIRVDPVQVQCKNEAAAPFFLTKEQNEINDTRKIHSFSRYFLRLVRADSDFYTTLYWFLREPMTMTFLESNDSMGEHSRINWYRTYV